jgi:DNA-binding Lrp family transcriptional regulator
METKAYILIETSVGKVREVASQVKGLSGVENAEAVTGPYDIIVTVSAPDLNAIGDLVTSRIHTIDGIVRTVTCLAVGSS